MDRATSSRTHPFIGLLTLTTNMATCTNTKDKTVQQHMI